MTTSRKVLLGTLLILIALCITMVLIAQDVIMLGPMPTLKTARHNPIQYYVSLPDGWSATKKWPILVTVDGANHDFLRNARTFMHARSGLPFIIVTPVVLSNVSTPNPADYNYSAAVWDEVAKTNPMQFDDKGLAAVISDVQADYNGEAKFFITGWSGGGSLTWFMVFTHPEQLAGAALACGNYFGHGIGTISSDPQRVHLPVKAFQGDQDPAYDHFAKQWRDAKKLADENGYQNLSYQIVAGAAHQPFPDQVFAFFANQLSGQN